MSSLASEIQTIITNMLPDATFIIASKWEINEQSHDLESTEYPLIVLDSELVNDGVITPSYLVNETERALVSFLAVDNPNNRVEESISIVDTQKGYARDLAARLFQDFDTKMLNSTEDFTYQIVPVYNKYAQALSGCVLSLQVRYNVNVNYCNS